MSSRSGGARSLVRPADRAGKAAGFSLIATVFVLLVLAALAAFAVKVGTAQQQTLDFGLLTARAQAAADSAIEYGAYLSVVTDTCVSGAVGLPAQSFAGFTVTLQCARSAARTVSGHCPPANCRAYTLTAIAQYGTYGNPDFVSRTVTRGFIAVP